MAKKDKFLLIAEKHGYADSILYRRLLETLITSTEAEIACAMISHPGKIDFEQLLPMLGLERAIVDDALVSLFRKGMLTSRNFKSRTGMRFTRGPIFMFMTNLSDLRMHAASSPVCSAWYDFAQQEFYPELSRLVGLSDSDVGRVIPYFKAIPAGRDVAPQEDLREFVKDTRVVISNCSCRQCMAGGHEPCRLTKDYRVCFNFGKAAEYILERGVGELITTGQALDIFSKCEEEGLVHVLDKNVATVCNCCDCCCMGISNCSKYHIPFSKILHKSSYNALTDTNLCKGCQTCLERCPFGAIEMKKSVDSAIYKSFVDKDKCFGCGACVVSCPTGARTLELTRPPEALEQWEPFETWLKRIKC